MELRLLGTAESTENVPENSKTNPKSHRHAPDRPRFPWQGVAALSSVVLLTAASVGVLFASRGSPIDHWKLHQINIQPQVWLSVLATITDGLTMVALANAAAVTFWSAAARGTTLRQMYDLYESQSFIGAIHNLVHLRGNRLAIASILCLVSALRGPLFQRASLIESNVIRATSGTQRLDVAQLIPPVMLWDNGAGGSALYQGIRDAFNAQTPIPVNITHDQCGDVCTGKVKVLLSE